MLFVHTIRDVLIFRNISMHKYKLINTTQCDELFLGNKFSLLINKGPGMLNEYFYTSNDILFIEV